MFDVAIVGGGPAGSTCAALCAQAGLQAVVLEREIFPREKVCGDCVNPACGSILERLQLAERVRELPHTVLGQVEFMGISGRSLTIDLPVEEAEIALKRSDLDHLLLKRARELGAIVYEQSTVTALTSPGPTANYWIITAGDQSIAASVLVAADGRNSTVARLCQLHPRITKERVALQTHLPIPCDFGNRVVLQFRPEGYSGQAPIGNSELNLCLVSTPDKITALRTWARARFRIPLDHSWRTATPLTRASTRVGHGSLFLVGDAARVVEPFTGEGIYYAMASGALLADTLVSRSNGMNDANIGAAYSAEHARLYAGRLWINRLARAAVLSPRVASAVLELFRYQPAVLRLLTAKVTRLQSYKVKSLNR